jgi:hypothetical protein
VDAHRGRSSFSAKQTTSFFFVSGFSSGAYSAKLFAGTRHRLSGFSQPRQCGEEVLRMLVTGGSLVIELRLHIYFGGYFGRAVCMRIFHSPPSRT